MNIFENIDANLPEGIVLNAPTKKGDKIVLIRSRNGAPTFEELEVVNGSRTSQSFNAKDNTNRTWTVYRSGNPEDEYIFSSDRKAIIVVLKSIKENVDTLVEYYTKFNSEEEYVAHKIEELLKADGIAAKAQVLKELKKSNYL